MTPGPLDVLMTRYGRYVRARVARIVAAEDVEDVCQQVWLAVWRRGGSFRGSSQFSSWLFRVATNHALSHLRLVKRRRLHVTFGLPSYDGDDLLELPFHDTGVRPDEAFERRQRAQQIQRRCRRLTSQERRALTGLLRGLTIGEQATQDAVPAGTIKSRRSRALAKLRRAAA